MSLKELINVNFASSNITPNNMKTERGIIFSNSLNVIIINVIDMNAKNKFIGNDLKKKNVPGKKYPPNGLSLPEKS